MTYFDCRSLAERLCVRVAVSEEHNKNSIKKPCQGICTSTSESVGPFPLVDAHTYELQRRARFVFLDYFVIKN